MLEELELNHEQICEIRDVLVARIRKGLAEDGQEVRALPAYLSPPPGSLTGLAIVVDTGGTNMRAALVEIEERGASIVRGPLVRRLPPREAQDEIHREQFFMMQAELVKELDPPRGLPVGYCFSYPSVVLPNRDARLIRWTKGIDVVGVEGTIVGEGLLEALHGIGVDPAGVCVLNDTVASLLGGSASRTEAPANVVGLIVGTGSNMAGYFDAASAPKLSMLGFDRMAINLESGNFHSPYLSRYDDDLDRQTDHPGHQRFEKAISGYYLPYLFARAVTELSFDPEEGSRQLVARRDEDEQSHSGKVAGLLLRRSADLVAAGLAAVIDFYDGEEEVAIIAEGALFWGDSRFAGRTRQTLDSLIERKTVVMRLENANLIGSACAALLH